MRNLILKYSTNNDFLGYLFLFLTRKKMLYIYIYIHTYLIYTAQILTKRSKRLYKLLPNAGRNTWSKNTKTKNLKLCVFCFVRILNFPHFTVFSVSRNMYAYLWHCSISSMQHSWKSLCCGPWEVHCCCTCVMLLLKRKKTK